MPAPTVAQTTGPWADPFIFTKVLGKICCCRDVDGVTKIHGRTTFLATMVTELHVFTGSLLLKQIYSCTYSVLYCNL
jgi:hypothetical protein